MTVHLDALRALSARMGADPDLVQGGGGNSSLKTDGELWIKASGTWLARAQDDEIFLAVDLDRLRRQIDAGCDDPTVDCFDARRGLRPSIETTLHALMPQRVVLHTHAVNTIAWAVRRDRDAALKARLDGLSWALVPYRRPGLPLTRAVETTLRRSSEIDVLILANHGLVVGGEDEDTVAAFTREVERRLAIVPRPAAGPDPEPLHALTTDGGWRPPGDITVHAIARDPACLALARRGALYPDHVVFLDAPLPVLEAGEDVDEVVERHEKQAGRPPVYLTIPGAGILVRHDITPGGEEMLRCLTRVLRRLEATAPLAYLGENDVAELVSWDAEQYRRTLDADAHKANPTA